MAQDDIIDVMFRGLIEMVGWAIKQAINIIGWIINLLIKAIFGLIKLIWNLIFGRKNNDTQDLQN